jgi:hypothetical protein
VVVPRTQVSLIDSASHETLVNEVLEVVLLCREHVVERVAILLEPKLIGGLYIASRDRDGGKGVVLGCVDDDTGVVHICHRSCASP